MFDHSLREPHDGLLRRRSRQLVRPGPCALAFSVGLLGVVAGCRLLADRGPIPESLATSQQLSQQAFACMQRDDWQRAEELLAEAIRRCPTSAEARRHYAETLWHREAFDGAVRQMETALELDRNNVRAAVRAGQMRLALGHLEKAQVWADRAIDLDSQLAAAWYLRGCVMKAAGATERALADFHRALDLAPNDRSVLLEVAELYRLRNQPHRALATLQYLADVYLPGEEPGQVLYLQGLACSALDRYQDAIDCYQMAVRRGVATAEVFFRLAEAQLSAGQVAAADQAVRQALACDARHEPSLRLLGRLETARQTTDRVRHR